MSREIINTLLIPGKQGKPWFYRYVLLSGQLVAGLRRYHQINPEQIDFELPGTARTIDVFFRRMTRLCHEADHPAFRLEAGALQTIPEDELDKLLASLVTADRQQLLNYQELPGALMALLEGSPCYPVALADDLVELMLGVLGLKSDDTVYCPFNSSLPLALAAGQRGLNSHIELEASPILPVVCNILLGGILKTGLGHPVTSPSWTEPGRLKPFTAGLAFPPLEARYHRDQLNDLYGRFAVLSHYGDLLHINHMVAQCQKSVIAVPQSFLQRTTGNERLGKKNLLAKGCIKAIISLPGLFAQTSVPPMALMVLDTTRTHDHVNFVDATNEYFIKRALGRNISRGRGNRLRNSEVLIEQASNPQSIKLARQVPCSAVEVNHYNLQVSRYVLSSQQVRLQRVIDDTPSEPLAQVAHLIRAQALRALTPEANPQGTLLLEVMPGDINEAGEVESPGKMVTVAQDCERARQQSLQPGDILLVVKGTVGKVGLVSSICGSNWVASQAFVIIRLKDNGPIKDPVVLFRYLCSPVGQALIDRIECTGKVSLLQTTDIQRLPVPVMTEAQQQQVRRTHQDIKKAHAEIRFLKDKAKGINAEVWSL